MSASAPTPSPPAKEALGILAPRPPSSGPEDFVVVGVGASAGGLEACRRLVDALPAHTGLAIILVQHLDPTHESLMVDLLSGHTTMVVAQAAEGLRIEPEHFYVIPPGTYLSVADGALHLSAPLAPHGSRLPIDFLLHSLADAYGPRAACVVLSGTGADGSLGLVDLKRKGGLVIAQDPEEADHDGMPRSAMQTGAVDLVLPAAEIPAALVAWDRRRPLERPEIPVAPAAEPDRLPEFVEVLRGRTGHDFTLYKPGTLQRRIARRMARVAIAPGDADAYLQRLRSDAEEADILAKDLLINVTGFFRDREVFDHLAAKTIPALVRDHALDHPLRIWVAGCSSGEEAYSIAMLVLEEVAATAHPIKLQIFASDLDAEAVAVAREGLYPKTGLADVTPARLARFFTKEDGGFRVTPELRGVVVFTVQDLLVDPPFSRLDLISCRNLLIYLGPEAQAKVLALFHFALRDGGILLLGSAETAGRIDDRFEAISKPERLYRRIGRSRPGDFGVSPNGAESVRVPPRPGQARAPSRQTALADLCRRLVMEAHAPAAVLIDHKHECLYALGPTDRYLQVASGYPSNDLLALAPEALRTKLRSAIQRATQEKVRIDARGGHINRGGVDVTFSIEVTPIIGDDEPMFLVCFVEAPVGVGEARRDALPSDGRRIAELEQDLAATRAELEAAIRNLEVSSEQQKAINEEALSVNEEYQSANEELLTSKEELQSLNEELTALNNQLQETLDRQRSTANDLQNVLFSTDVATLFLDAELKIRFFTPATKALFRVIPGDVGRPLADLHSLAADTTLLIDAQTILKTLVPIEREIETPDGRCFVRRVLPYRILGDGVEGVVITFVDITERRRIAEALELAMRRAEQANIAKSRFLAAASHDLRQPLQTQILLLGLLSKVAEGDKARQLLVRLDNSFATMTAMLDTLLDMNQIEAGTVKVEKSDFAIGDLFARLKDEFDFHAQAKGIELHVVPSRLLVHSDPRLLEQMVRNLLANALKYTSHGRVLLGCRRHGARLAIEVWDTGIGIPDDEFQAIFDEYHQIANPARQHGLGLGLGLSIVKRLGELLDLPIALHSHLGKGSVFSIEVDRPQAAAAKPRVFSPETGAVRLGTRHDTGSILVIEDEPEVRELLQLLLEGEGHRVQTAADGRSALTLVAATKTAPDLILADYNLPGEMTGLQVATRLRERFRRAIPVVVLTGDISTATLRDIAQGNCIHLEKPVKPQEMTAIIARALASVPAEAPPIEAAAPAKTEAPPSKPVPLAERVRPATVFVVDDDDRIRADLGELLESEGLTVVGYATCEAFLEAYRPGQVACLLIDAYLPGMSGLELLKQLTEEGHMLPAIMITGRGAVSMAVEAMKAGASDFIEKPVGRDVLLGDVERALVRAREQNEASANHETAAARLARLTTRQRQIMNLVLAGQPSKNIAADLGISQRTVENHRAAIMTKTGTKSLPALARLVVSAGP